MRVVSGSARGRRLVAPVGTTTRPTSDRAREGIFNMVGSRMSLADARVVDLFAGSGAMGIEALSRGAAHVTFVEHDRRAVEAIRTNLTTLGFDDLATVVTGDVMAWSRARARQLAAGRSAPPPTPAAPPAALTAPATAPATAAASAPALDIVFADPPYAFDEWEELAAAFADCALLVAESDRPVGLGEGWGLLTERRYGGTVVVLASPSPSRKVNP